MAESGGGSIWDKSTWRNDLAHKVPYRHVVSGEILQKLRMKFARLIRRAGEIRDHDEAWST